MRVLVVDDHRLFRDGMKSLLAHWRGDAVIVEAGRLGEAVGLLGGADRFDLILLDLTLPDSQDFEDTLGRMRRAAPQVPIVAVSMHDQRPVVATAIRLGARGFIRKTDSANVMIGALEMVLAGGSCVPAELLCDDRDLPHDAPPLSERQREVLGLIARGLSNKEIARQLGIAEPTVKVHVHRILQLVGTSSRAKAAVWARRAGLGPGSRLSGDC